MLKVSFDVTQKERGSPTTVYKTLKSILENMGVEVSIYSEYPIRESGIRGSAVFVIGCPVDSRLNQGEIDAILSYVRNGRSLLVLSNAGGDTGNRTNLNDLISYFGIKFNTDQVLDPFSNLGVESMPLLQVSATHPILDNVAEICYRSGCSLTTGGEALPLIFTSPNSEPPNAPVLAVAEYHKGRVVVIGSYSIFRDALKGGIETKDNKRLAINIFRWLMEKAGVEAMAPKVPKGLEERVAALEKEVKMLKAYIKELVSIFSAATMGGGVRVPAPPPTSGESPKKPALVRRSVKRGGASTPTQPTTPVQSQPASPPTAAPEQLPASSPATSGPGVSAVEQKPEQPPATSGPTRAELERQLQELTAKLQKGLISKTEYAKERARIKKMLANL